nr:hypothetical protein CFP56_73686 [Quercus suber]
MPPKKKARKVRHVDEVTTLEHGHRQRQERERSVTPDGGEIDEVAMVDKIYTRIARAVQGGHRREGCLFGEFHKQNPPTFDGGPDPMATENWLLKMEKLLRALECTDAQKEHKKLLHPEGFARYGMEQKLNDFSNWNLHKMKHSVEEFNSMAQCQGEI